MKRKLIGMILAAGAALGAWAANVRLYVSAPSAVAWGDNWYCYAWDDGELLGGWPGTKTVKTETRDGVTWHYWDITATGDFNLIINNGPGDKETGDFAITGVSDGKAYFIEVAKSGGNHSCQIVNVGVVASTHNKVQLWENGPYWAETNIGADEPWDSGYYFWWGDTNGYTRVGDAWVANDGSSDNFSFEEANTPTYGKDTATLLSEGWITGGGILVPEHDAAHVQWGDGWRMPTYQEMYALTTKCDREWVTTNGVKGYVFRGKGDYSANSIFLPVTGIGTTTSFSDFDSGCYWSSDHQSGPYHSVQIWFGSGFFTSDDYYGYRLHGQSVRPIQDAPSVIVSFNLNYDGGGTTNMSIYSSAKVLASAPAVSARAGWTFVGWYTADGTRVAEADTPVDGATYYAHWGEGEFTMEGPWFVDEDGNWHSGRMPNTGRMKLSTVFEGPGTLSFEWMISSQIETRYFHLAVDGEYKEQLAIYGETTDWLPIQYEVGEGQHEISLIFSLHDSYVENDNHYGAMRNWTWTPAERVAVTFDENFDGGNVVETNVWVKGKVLDYAPVVASRPGWAFVGWFTAPKGGTEIAEDTLPVEGATYYAHWEESHIITIGSGTGSNSYLPTYSLYKYSLTQQIYTSDEIGGAYSIKSIAFKNAGDERTRTLDIYLVHTSKDSFSGKTDWIAVTAADKVFSGDVTFTSGEWTTVTFDVPFAYNGTDNLAVIIDDNTGSYYGGMACQTFETQRMGIYVYSDNVDYDPFNPGSYNGTVMNVKNQIQLGIANLGPVMPDLMITAGDYFKATLVELGYDVPTNGTAYKVVAYGLPAGLKLMSNKAVTKKSGKKTVVVTPANVEWWIEGVPTAALDYATNPPYLVITTNGVAQTLPLSLGVEAQEVTELPDLALGETINAQFYLEGVTNGWTVSGLPTGLKYTPKLVTTTKKKGKKIISVTTNALPYSVYGKTTKAGLFTITAKKKAGAFYETMKYRVLVKPAKVDTERFGEELTNITTMAYVPVEWDLKNGGEWDGGHAGRVTLPAVAAVGGNVAKVTGLPKGLAFAASDTYGYANAKKKTGKYLKQKGQTIVGTPTKPGTYVVTFTKNETTGTGKKKKTVAKTAQIFWTVTENDAELSLGFNEKGGVIESGTVGLSYGDLMAFDATDGAKVTASGLPAGIKLADLGGGKYAFTGFTAKAGTYLVTVTATLNGKTVRQRVALKVDGLPSWAKGTYNGVVYATSGDLDYAGYGTVSVSAAGKISGKFSENGTNWTFSASSYDFYTDKGGYDGDTEIFQCTNVVAKYAYKVTEKVKGKKKTVTKYLTRNYTLSAGNLEISPGVMRGTVVVTSNGDDGLVAYQNVWGQSGYKALGKKLFYTSKKVPCKTWSDVDAKGLTDAMSLSVKVTSAGALTATMTFDTGKTTTDKKTKKKSKVYYKATCTTVLIPLSEADADPFKAGVSLYFAPSAADNFPGFCAEVEYPFAKRVAPQPGMANNWYTGEFTGYGDAQFPVDGGDTDILNGLVSINVAANLSFTGTFAATDGTTASFSGTFVKDGDMYAANGVAITVRGQAMTMRLGCAAQPYADKDAGFGEMWGGSDAEPGEPCIALNCLWQNIWKRSDLSAEWKPAFASGTEKTLDMSEIWLDGKVDGDTLTYAFGADGAVAVSGKIYGETVSSTATLDLEGYDDGTNTMYCNFYFLANGHMYQQQLTFQRQASIASSDITLASFQRVD